MFKTEWEQERIDRHIAASQVVPFGVSYLDDALVGLLPNELFLVGARTGRGKTEFATTLAAQASERGRRVAFFALEADQWEIQRRMKYRKLVQLCREHYGQSTIEQKFPRLREWLTQGYVAEFDALEKEVIRELEPATAELKILYKGGNYSPEQFVSDMETLSGDTDLFIVDHLHYFDIGGRNESEGLKKAIHAVRNSALYLGKPVVLLAHLRKGDRTGQKALPELDDFHGHSDIVKVATTVLLLGAVPPEKLQGDEGMYPTYFHIAKCRTAGEVTPYVGILGFDMRQNRYGDRYYLAQSQHSSDPEIIHDSGKIPAWAKRANRNRQSYSAPPMAPAGVRRGNED